MMKVLIKLNNGEALLPALRKIKDYEIVGFYANSVQYIDTEQSGLHVYSLHEAIRMYKSGVVSCFILNALQSIDAIRRDARTFQSYGIETRAVLVALPEFIETGYLEKVIPAEEYRRLPYVEYHVADHCNLNCKGCVHFSPLVKDKIFPVFAEVEKDLRQLNRLVPYIDNIRILGGEPFLNRELPKYMQITRDIYPYANITVVTNGLLLKSCSFLDDFVKYRIGIDISLYKPMMANIDIILKMLRDKGILAGVSDPIEDFAYALDKQGGHARFAKRHNCTCPNLYNGGLYVCPVIAYMKYFNKAFGYSFDEMDGRIDIYDSSLDFEKLQEELHKVRRTCDNCLYISGEHMVSRPWEQTLEATVDDYMI